MQTNKRSTSILEIVALTSPDGRYDSLFLSNYATINLLDEIARLDGVGNVAVFGAGQYAIRIWLDPQKLQARGLVPQDVINAVNLQSRSTSAGQVGLPPVPQGQTFQYSINVRGKLDDVAEFEKIIVKTDKGGRITRVQDVATVELGAQQYSQTFKLDGQPSAGMAIYQLPNANALEVAKRVETRMNELAKAFPEGMTWVIPFDTTKFVSSAVHDVYKTLIEAAVLVLVVILVFLQDWRATLVPATTVPVTIIGAFAAMAALGFTVNLSTLFAIILAIGIVVDDAIIVVEGAAKHIEHGLTPHDAAIKAMDELLGPILGITLVLMAVFIPAAFLPGLSGQMYRQFALVIAATALISAINAMTLKPTQCALWLRPVTPPEQRNFLYRGFNRVYNALERAYTGLIRRMVGHAGLMSLIVGGLVVLAVCGLSRVPTGFLPIEDQGYFLVIVQLPEGAALERTTRALDDITTRVKAQPGVDKVVAIAGLAALNDSASLSNAGVAYVILKDWDERERGRGPARALQGPVGARQRHQRRHGTGDPAPGHPGHRQRRRRHDEGGDPRRLLRLRQAAAPRPGRNRPGRRPVDDPIGDQCVPRRRAADQRRDRPHQGGDARRAARQCARRAQLVRRLDLRRPVQQVRPRVPDLRAGGRRRAHQRRQPAVSAGAQQRRQHGAVRHAGIDQDRRRPLGDQPL